MHARDQHHVMMQECRRPLQVCMPGEHRPTFFRSTSWSAAGAAAASVVAKRAACQVLQQLHWTAG
jgi:hypothetical protein